MSWRDWVLLVMILGGMVLALWRIRSSKGCCSGCSGNCRDCQKSRGI